jgi:23S rRNA pseudouridine1911/1915/1917 synthase
MFHVKQSEYRVQAACELLQFLTELMPESSRSKVKELLAHNVCVDGRRVSQFNYPLQPGMVVTIEKAGYKERLKPRDLDIVYEDEHLMVVNKHEGLLSNSKKPTEHTVITVLNRYLHLTHQKCNAHIVTD